MTSESPGPSALLVQGTKTMSTTSLPALWSCEYFEVLELLKAALDRILCRQMKPAPDQRCRLLPELGWLPWLPDFVDAGRTDLWRVRAVRESHV